MVQTIFPIQLILAELLDHLWNILQEIILEIKPHFMRHLMKQMYLLQYKHLLMLFLLMSKNIIIMFILHIWSLFHYQAFVNFSAIKDIHIIEHNLLLSSS